MLALIDKKILGCMQLIPTRNKNTPRHSLQIIVRSIVRCRLIEKNCRYDIFPKFAFNICSCH